MINKFKQFYTNNLKYTGREKLSTGSTFLIICLDLFVFFILLQGLMFQTKVLHSPVVKYPYGCIVVLKNPSKIFIHTSRIYNNNNYYKRRVSGVSDSIYDKERSPFCNTIIELTKNVKKHVNIEEYRAQVRKLKTKETNLNNQLNNIRKNYNTILFEKIAKNETSEKLPNDLDTKNAKIKYENLKKMKELNSSNLTKKIQQFKTNIYVKELHSYVVTKAKSVLAKYEETKESYYLKKKGVEILFLIPLLFVFFKSCSYFMKKENYIFHIISKNLLFVTLIPFIGTLSGLVYKYLPREFIAKVLDFFYSLEIPFVAYYILLFLGITIGVLLIIKMQQYYKQKLKKEENNKLSFSISYNKSICNNCHNTVDYNKMQFCPHCSNRLVKQCSECGSQTIKGLKYCLYCGKEMCLDDKK